MFCVILYLENSDKARFSNLKKRVENDYVLNKSEYQRTVATVHSLLLKYQPTYNFNIIDQSNGVRNQLMFAQGGKTGDNKGDGKYKDQRPRRNLDRLNCTKCGDKGHYSGNSERSTKKNLKDDKGSLRKMKQLKYANKTPGGGEKNVGKCQRRLMQSHDGIPIQ